MKIINKLKEYKIFIIALLLAILVFNIKLPYYVMAPGGIINLNERISYQDLNGNINMLYVSEYDVQLPHYLWQVFLKSGIFIN